jgi:signal transduction histidine kinase
VTTVPTVRARITALATAAVLVVLVVAGAGLVLQQRRLLTGSLDESLQQHADELGQPARDAAITGLGEDDAMAQIVIDGAVIASTANVAGRPPVAPIPAEPGERVRTVASLPHEDSSFRLLVRVPADGDAAVLVAAPLDDIDESIDALIRSLLLAVPLVVVALAAVLWWLVGRTLRPVEAIRTEVARIGGRDLHRRVPVPPGDDEIARMARTMNDMLARVDGAAQRQQRFVADASHELRSPLARMRAELEVDLAHPAEADLLATHASLLDEAIGL